MLKEKARGVRPSHIEPFEYMGEGDAAFPPGWDLWAGSGAEPGSAQAAGGRTAHAASEDGQAPRMCDERRLAEETRQAFDNGRAQGRQEGAREEREAQNAASLAAEERRRRQAAELIAGFAGERESYLRAVEREVVELALRIAAHILRREAQMDPLLLTGAVRVALGQLAESTAVRVVVPQAEFALWSETLKLAPSLPIKPAVVADSEMRLGDCRIESELGSVDLGVRAQLEEIERGFFDGRQARPPRRAGVSQDLRREAS